MGEQYQNIKEQEKITQKMMDYWLEHGTVPTEGKGKNSKYRRPFMPEEWKQQVKAKKLCKFEAFW